MYKTTFHTQVHGWPQEVHIRELEGMGEAADIAQNVSEWPRSEHQRCASVRENFDFTGTHSLSEAVDLARNGWEEGKDHITEEMKRIQAPELIGHSTQPTPFWDVSGEDVDVGRYLSGDPESMIAYDMPPAKQGKIIEFLVNCSQSAYVSKERIVRRGAAIVAAAQRLSADGYSVGVTAGTGSQGQGMRVEYYVPIVRPGQYVDIDALSFTLTHASFLRRLIFAVRETESPRIRSVMGYYNGGGYGTPRNLEHPPEAPHPRVLLQKDDAMRGGVEAAQAILDEAISKLRPPDA